MGKVKLLRRQLKTVAKYVYRPEFHGEWSDLILALEETFDITEEYVPPRRNKVRVKNEAKRGFLPPPIPKAVRDAERRNRLEERSRNYIGHKITIHRGTPTTRTLCGSNGYDVVTTMEDAMVNCTNCLLPKHQAKLRQENSQSSNNEVRENHPHKQLPRTPHFLNSDSSEM